jgi:hypothetical protein
MRQSCFWSRKIGACAIAADSPDRTICAEKFWLLIRAALTARVARE